jgi:hypothetical protein
LFRKRIMAPWWGRNVNDVRRNSLQHFFRIGKALSNTETLTELLGHKRFPIANGNNLGVRNTMDRRHMLVGDLAAAYERDPQGARG